MLFLLDVSDFKNKHKFCGNIFIQNGCNRNKQTGNLINYTLMLITHSVSNKMFNYFLLLLFLYD